MNAPDDFAQPPIRARLYLAIALATAIAFAVAALLYGRPGYRTLKDWRAQQLAHKAEELVSQQQWREALQAAQAAFQMGPNDPKTLRTLARLQAHISAPEALELYLKLCNQPQVSSDDLRELARLALTVGKVQLAQNVLADLLQNGPANVSNLILGTDFALATGDINAALAYANRAHAIAPANRTALLTKARLLTLNSKTQSEAAQMLLKLAIPSTDQSGLDALEILARLTDIPAEDSRLAAEALTGHPLAKLPHKLLAEQVKLRLRPSERNSILDSAIEKYSHPEKDRVTLARWLNQIKEHQRVIQLIPESMALHAQNLFLARVDAMAALKQWQEIDTLLSNTKVPLSIPIRELYRARCARELGQKVQAETHWERAILEAASDPNPHTLWYLADYALRLNERAQAWKIFDRLSQNPITARRAYENLIRMAEQESDTARLLEIIMRASKDYPEDPAPRNDITYLQLLLDQRSELAQTNAEQLFNQRPHIMAFRVTCALAKLKTNQPAQALQLFDDVTFSPQELLPGWQAVYAATLAHNNRIEDAKLIAAKIPLDRLKPQERELISGLR